MRSAARVPALALALALLAMPAAAKSEFTNADLSGRSFANKDLRGASFTNVTIEGTDFRGADLTGAEFTNCKGQPLMDGALLDGADVTNCSQVFAVGRPAPAARFAAPTPVLVDAGTIRSAVREVGGSIDLRVQFPHDSALLDASGAAQAEQILEALIGAEGVFLLTGHTDADGGDAYNDRLSLARAQALADYLAAGGIPAGKVRVAGEGERSPVADNATDAGKAMNRRVTVARLR